MERPALIEVRDLTDEALTPRLLAMWSLLLSRTAQPSAAQTPWYYQAISQQAPVRLLGVFVNDSLSGLFPLAVRPRESRLGTITAWQCLTLPGEFPASPIGPHPLLLWHALQSYGPWRVAGSTASEQLPAMCDVRGVPVRSTRAHQLPADTHDCVTRPWSKLLELPLDDAGSWPAGVRTRLHEAATLATRHGVALAKCALSDAAPPPEGTLDPAIWSLAHERRAAEVHRLFDASLAPDDPTGLLGQAWSLVTRGVREVFAIQLPPQSRPRRMLPHLGLRNQAADGRRTLLLALLTRHAAQQGDQMLRLGGDVVSRDDEWLGPTLPTRRWTCFTLRRWDGAMLAQAARSRAFGGRVASRGVVLSARPDAQSAAAPAASQPQRVAR